MSEPIVRIAARGEGVTPSGRHVPFGVPGDVIADDGAIVPGPGHQVPPCRHFPECGGCQLQHLSDSSFADYCASRVAGALAQHGIETEVRPALLSPPRSRRRASLRALKAGGRVLIGFNAHASNRIVDMRECYVLRPELFELVAPLRKLLGTILPAKRTGEIQLTLADQGVDVVLKGVTVDGLAAIEALTEFCERHRLARLSIDEGYGAEPRFEPRPATVTLAGRAVALPVGAFLQATVEGERALTDAVLEAVGEAERPLDLFAGLGTFALALPGRAGAAEASREAVLALKAAAPMVEVQHRDLYRRPFDAAELAAHDAVVLDPPRAGAEQQVRALAASSVPQIAYVSCNPATFARDARLLADGGYRLLSVQPVGQFLWSTHVELAAAFAR
ncbi:class I SAM-dependent RNA methyltransferase [Sphingomonas mesophila]|uniref:class I SAM-dependent RNA methyltransferase n=1 Tax=Sphingomonas mesophila TaxID=2303576 RepID=UPI000E56F2C5|nr:class I SAM-dependent RNA methyltransferase [Sphingomonas mesophila]